MSFDSFGMWLEKWWFEREVEEKIKLDVSFLGLEC